MHKPLLRSDEPFLRLFQRSLFIFLTLSLCFSLTAEAAAPICRSVFTPNLRDYIEKLNQDSHQVLFQDKTLAEHIETLSWMKKRRLRKILNNETMNIILSQEAVMNYASEVTLLLYGNRRTVDSYIFKTKNEREQRVFRELLSEQILAEGLIQFWKNHSDPEFTRWNQFVEKLNNFITYGWGQVLRMPWIAPDIKNKPIPKELAAAIIRDGFEAHAEDIHAYLRSQNRIESYSTFKRLYTPVLLGAIFLFNGQIAYEKINSAVENKAQDYIVNLQKTRNQLPKGVQDIKNEILERAYEGALEDFRKKWNDEPTDTEKQKIRDIIEQGLNSVSSKTDQDSHSK